MTKKPGDPTGKPKVIVFGLLDSQRPRAGWFSEGQAAAAEKAAKALGLDILPITGPVPPELGKQIRQGHTTAAGFDLIGRVPVEAYEALVRLALAQATAARCLPPITAEDRTIVSKLRPADVQEFERQVRAVAYERSLGRTPANWQAIRKGTVVLAQDNLEDGWFEAIVDDRKGELLTLHWRDFPKQPPLMRHCSAVALLSPTPN